MTCSLTYFAKEVYWSHIILTEKTADNLMRLEKLPKPDHIRGSIWCKNISERTILKGKSSQFKQIKSMIQSGILSKILVINKGIYSYASLLACKWVIFAKVEKHWPKTKSAIWYQLFVNLSNYKSNLLNFFSQLPKIIMSTQYSYLWKICT